MAVWTTSVFLGVMVELNESATQNTIYVQWKLSVSMQEAVFLYVALSTSSLNVVATGLAIEQ